MASVNLGLKNVSGDPWIPTKVTDETVNQLMLQKFLEIVTDYHQRNKRRSKADLTNGPWYANDCANALERGGAASAERFNWLKEHNSFYHGLAPKGFRHEKNSTKPTGRSFCTYQVVDAKASQALAQVREGPASFIECGSAVQIARYQTLITVLGEKRFDKIFSVEGKCPLKLSPHLSQTPLAELGIVDEFRVSEINYLVGDHVHASNIPLYHRKHPHGEDGGCHMVFGGLSEGEKKYHAFGFPPEGLTMDEVYDLLVERYNSSPVKASTMYSMDFGPQLDGEYVPIKKEVSELLGRDIDGHTIDRSLFDEVVQETFDNPPGKRAGLGPFVTRFNVEKIRGLLTGSSDEKDLTV